MPENANAPGISEAPENESEKVSALTVPRWPRLRALETELTLKWTSQE